MLIILFFIVFFISLLISCVIIKYARIAGKMIDRDSVKKPQKMHSGDIVRGGGVGIFVSFCIGIAILAILGNVKFLMLIIPMFFVFVSGILEDLNYAISPKMRLLLQSVGVGSAILLFPNYVITDIGFTLPYGFGVFFTLFCIVGVTNAINIIDGFNALAGGFAVFVLISIAIVSVVVGNIAVFCIAIMLLGAICGFLVLNFPNAKIFLGDGGAYLVGFLLAFLLVALTQDLGSIAGDSLGVSAYYGLCIMIYPVFEVLFSIWRRKYILHHSAMQPDSLHLHMLIFKRITHSNPQTSVLIWLFNAPFIALGSIFYDNAPILIALIALFIALYIFIYKRIIRFKSIFIKKA